MDAAPVSVDVTLQTPFERGLKQPQDTPRSRFPNKLRHSNQAFLFRRPAKTQAITLSVSTLSCAPIQLLGASWMWADGAAPQAMRPMHGVSDLNSLLGSQCFQEMSQKSVGAEARLGNGCPTAQDSHNSGCETPTPKI